MAKSALDLKAIIQRATKTAQWLNFPKATEARSPLDRRQTVSWRIDPTTVQEAFRDSNRKQPMLELWSVVIGVVPPIPGASTQLEKKNDARLVGLKDAHACFQGVNRPISEDPRGANMLAYIVKSRFCFSYQDESFCSVKVLNLPPDVVLVIYVLTDEAYNKSGANLGGVVSHWSFVETDQNDPMLPVDFDKRFAHRIW